MNVNRNKKCVFMCHPNTGEKDISEYFGKIGFERVFPSNLKKGKKLERHYYSTQILYPWLFDDYKLIVTMDNPYRRIVNFVKETSNTNWKLKKYSKEDLYQNFNKNLGNLFVDDLTFVKTNNIQSENVYSFLLPYDFTKKNPDYIIKIDNIVEDVKKIDVLDHLDYNFHLIDQIDISDDYKDVFSYENARSVYKSHRHIFEMMSYDPFSFTTRELSREEKIKFIHY